MKERALLILGVIVLIAGLLRFVGLANNPPSLTWDEAAWGYNAYSIGKDGKDEFGRFLPITYLESFGDFKPPVYAYLSVLPVKLFGLNEFSTRFASAFFGTLTVLLTYFLVLKLFPVRGKQSSAPTAVSPAKAGSQPVSLAYASVRPRSASPLALIAAGLLAISPWHILLSRAAFEANVATFFIVLGVYLFFVSLEKRWMLVFSALAFIISMYTFNTARIVSPLLLLGLVSSQRKYMFENMKKQTVIAGAIGALVFIPLFLFLLTPQAKLRFDEVNIFTDREVVERANQQIQNDNNAFWSNIIHNRRVGYTIEYFKHYFDNLSPRFLFIEGDGNPKFSIQDVGQLYLWEVPFLIAGILFLFRKKEGHWWFIPFWLIVGIIPAGTARETPHALRIETVLPTFQILTAIGIYYLARMILNLKYQILKIHLKYLIFSISILFFTFNFLYFAHTYFVHYPREYSADWQYGYREAIAFTKENEDEYENIIFTEAMGRPYIYVLFYKQYDPVNFREVARVDREALGFVHVRSFEKYKFVKSVKDNISENENNLYVDRPWDVPDGARAVATFAELDGRTTLVAYTL